MITANDDVEEILENARKLLFDLKVTLKTIFKEKNEIFRKYKV